jgi:hypothetical protein
MSDTQTIDTTCLEDFTIAVSMSHNGGVDASGLGIDTVRISYQIDDGPEVIWVDIAGDQYSSTAEVTVASGSQLTIRTVGDTSADSEFYYIQLWVLVPGAPIPAPAPVAPIPAPVAPVPMPVAWAPIAPIPPIGTCPDIPQVRGPLHNK